MESLTPSFTRSISEACTLTSQFPLFWGSHSFYDGILAIAEVDANRARKLQSARLWGITRTHQPPRQIERSGQFQFASKSQLLPCLLQEIFPDSLFPTGPSQDPSQVLSSILSVTTSYCHLLFTICLPSKEAGTLFLYFQCLQ